MSYIVSYQHDENILDYEGFDNLGPAADVLYWLSPKQG